MRSFKKRYFQLKINHDSYMYICAVNITLSSKLILGKKKNNVQVFIVWLLDKAISYRFINNVLNRYTYS